MAGFRSPLFVLGLGASQQRAGFRSPLPIPPFGADAVQRAGFVTPLPFYFGYAGEPIEPPVEPVEERRVGAGSRRALRDFDDIRTVLMAVSISHYYTDE